MLTILGLIALWVAGWYPLWVYHDVKETVRRRKMEWVEHERKRR